MQKVKKLKMEVKQRNRVNQMKQYRFVACLNTEKQLILIIYKNPVVEEKKEEKDSDKGDQEQESAINLTLEKEENINEEVIININQLKC